MGGAGTALIVFGALVLIGAPIVLNLPKTLPEWTGLAFESAAIGLVVELFVAIVLLHAGYYSPITALLLTVAIVGGAVFALRRTGARSNTPAADRSLLRSPQPALMGIATLALILFGLWIRRRPSYFIFQTGDMGGYVNSANILMRAHMPFGTQPHGLTLFLRETNLILGRANTVAGVPALGAILIVGTIAFARALGVHAAAALAIGFVMVVHPIPVWFSLFPVSEALFATLLIALLYFIVRARSKLSPAYAVIAGITAGSLLLVRGEAMLFAPIILLVMLASAAVDDDATTSIQRRFTLVALVSLFASYAYDAKYNHLYFRAQLRHLLPDVLSNFAEDARLIDLSVFLFLAGALALALALLAVRLVTRFVRPRVVERPLLFWRYAHGAVILIAVVALLTFELSGLSDTLSRWGAVLLVLVAIGIVSIAVRPGRYVDAASGLMFLIIVAVYCVLFARRVPAPKVQTYYLYFDRYLFSEVLPAALPLAAIGIRATIEACSRYAPNPRVARAAIAVVVAIIVVGIVPQTQDTRRETKFRLFGKSYQALDRLDELTRSEGDGAVVYSGSKGRVTNWFYPNTYRAFALPLQQSFHRDVFGIPPKGLGRDVVYTPEQARGVLERNNFESGYLVQLRRRGEKKLPDDDRTRFLGTVNYSSPILGQTTSPPAAPWEIAQLRLDVYALEE